MTLRDPGHPAAGRTVVCAREGLRPAAEQTPAAVAAELAQLRAEYARLRRLLKLTPREAAPPGPGQAGFFDAPPGLVHSGSPPQMKVGLFGKLFAARTDIYALRWENARTGRAGWLPAERGGWRKGIPHAEREYLPLTAEVLAAHLSGQEHIGLYPLLNGDRCWWLAADFDGPAALLDALSYVKAARALNVPVGLELSRSGVGAHTWIFFTAPVPAETARRLGTGLLREAMALRGQMSLSSYDRLFPSQDVGLTATPYRRDRLDDLIGLQVGPARYTISRPAARASGAPGRAGELPGIDAASGVPVPRPVPVLHVHPTGYRYAGDADPSAPGGIAAIYRDLAADDSRVAQVIADVTSALARGRNCLVLTKWISHLNRLAGALCERGFDPVLLRGGMGARSRAAAMARLQPREGRRPLLVVATGSCIGEGFDCPALDTLFLAAPVGYKGSIIQWAGRILRSLPGKTTAEVHHYHDLHTPVIAATLGKRAPGYTSLGFPDPRRLALTPSSQADPQS
jgi:TOTE conflict system, Archaeo-Eukaryotic Primase domain/Helicase conserved C-terminal domain